jgi:hypothetical protein
LSTSSWVSLLLCYCLAFWLFVFFVGEFAFDCCSLDCASIESTLPIANNRPDF